MNENDPSRSCPDLNLKELTARFHGFMDLMNERDRRYEARFWAQDEKTSLALTASKEAVLKAETATEKRFEGVNEFRKTLSDQASSFLSRSEAEVRFLAIGDKLEAFGGYRNRTEGRASGISASWVVVAFISGPILLGIIEMIVATIGKK